MSGCSACLRRARRGSHRLADSRNLSCDRHSPDGKPVGYGGRARFSAAPPIGGGAYAVALPESLALPTVAAFIDAGRTARLLPSSSVRAMASLRPGFSRT
jgi:hypothetical protein